MATKRFCDRCAEEMPQPPADKEDPSRMPFTVMRKISPSDTRRRPLATFTWKDLDLCDTCKLHIIREVVAVLASVTLEKVEAAITNKQPEK